MSTSDDGNLRSQALNPKHACRLLESAADNVERLRDGGTTGEEGGKNGEGKET